MANNPSLAETHPEVANQWHLTKNGNLSSKDVTHGSHKMVWWKCDKGDDHEWEAKISDRTYINSKGGNCPKCYRDFKIKFPEHFFMLRGNHES